MRLYRPNVNAEMQPAALQRGCGLRFPLYANLELANNTTLVNDSAESVQLHTNTKSLQLHARLNESERGPTRAGPGRVGPAEDKAGWLSFNPVIPELRTHPREGGRKRRGEGEALLRASMHTNASPGPVCIHKAAAEAEGGGCSLFGVWLHCCSARLWWPLTGAPIFRLSPLIRLLWPVSELPSGSALLSQKQGHM